MNKIYTPEDVAQLLQISKHTVYELIKRKDLTAFKVGNKMRIEEKHLENYKQIHSTSTEELNLSIKLPSKSHILRLHGSHDLLLEKISQTINNHHSLLTIQPTFMGSLEGCMSLYRNDCDIAAIHLYDQTRQQYNLPIIEQFFPGDNITIIHLADRRQGFITQRDNPKRIYHWHDLVRNDVTFINRQTGSGTRQLIDSQLKRHHIHSADIHGYDSIESTHYSAANQIISNQADVTIGIEPVSNLLGLSFYPITKESYDLVCKSTDCNSAALSLFMNALKSPEIQKIAQDISGYDLTNMGNEIFNEKS